MPELRIDPLSGHRTIVAGERSRAARAARPRCAPAPSRSTSSAIRSPRATRTGRRPSSYALRPGGGRPDSPGWTVRVVPNLYPALAPAERGGDGRPRRADRRARRSRAVRLAAGDRRARGDRQRAPAGALAGRAPASSRSSTAIEVWRERMRAHDEQRLRAADRQRAPRGGRVAAAHARAAVRARLRAGGGRARARARGRLHDAHDGPEPARRPGRRGGAARRADRGDRRRGGADGAVRLAAALSADARPAPRRGRASRTTARPARRCCTTGCAGWRATSARARR